VGGINNFQSIVRFDERDVLSNTNEIEYGITNRLYAKDMSAETCESSSSTESGSAEQAPAAPGGAATAAPVNDQTANPPAAGGPQQESCEPSSPRELLTWRVAQKHFFNPTFGGALIPGQANVFTTSVEFTGIAFLSQPVNYSPVISRLHFQAGAVDAEWNLDYDLQRGRIDASTAIVSYTFGQFGLAGSHAYLQIPGQPLASVSALAVPLKFNQWRILGRYGNPNRTGFNLAAGAGVDANLNHLQYSIYQATYNWDCCGLTFELRRFALGPVRNENQYLFAFSLANIGTFGTLKRQERLF
jgi:LPS-assembly protein